MSTTNRGFKFFASERNKNEVDIIEPILKGGPNSPKSDTDEQPSVSNSREETDVVRSEDSPNHQKLPDIKSRTTF